MQFKAKAFVFCILLLIISSGKEESGPNTNFELQDVYELNYSGGNAAEAFNDSSTSPLKLKTKR